MWRPEARYERERLWPWSTLGLTPSLPSYAPFDFVLAHETVRAFL